jgi:hypothetical protein
MSGRISARLQLLKAEANGEDPGDFSTLAE